MVGKRFVPVAFRRVGVFKAGHGRSSHPGDIPVPHLSLVGGSAVQRVRMVRDLSGEQHRAPVPPRPDAGHRPPPPALPLVREEGREAGGGAGVANLLKIVVVTHVMIAGLMLLVHSVSIKQAT